ncbi:fructose-1,6-bisphosphatase/inositol monophosphatase family enzyme [Roseibium hamelinense]|uniref:Fructose-1,6-bisphosphatase/inositol monophosphatase family enzyme n=1 Tax=Roseibium hamelinense TaxID=150831 RepID=A0A562SVE1_9HYPH|nr:inositol monophosphatase family protein [Roseibium hamelinense]MTI43205.1 hypothetical protein [Roseibium hamelinense]TWI84746.1 fructose-1,6-bisphosphatase/inositol monophosphatase family enzyme [Roseibium hamelinense]
MIELPVADCAESQSVLKIAQSVLGTWHQVKDETDARIERHLFDIIRADCPGAKCFGEETTGPFELAADGPSFLVDPIDGSHNRERGLPYFAVSIAMYSRGRVLASLVFAPEWSVVFLGVSGKAYKSTPFGVQRLKVRGPAPRHNRAIALFKRQLVSGQSFPEKVRTISCSSIEVCLVAQGALDGFVDSTGYEKQCDIAAALHILHVAGGHFQYDCPVDPLTSADPQWLRPRRLLAVSQKEYLNDYGWA